jgi:hypothetical protein
MNMTCEQIAKWMPDYMQGTLRAEERMQMEEHLRECVECKDEVAVWQKLSLLPDETPSPMMRERFDAMLGAYEQGRWERKNLKAQRDGMKPAAFGWQNFSVPQLALTMALVFVAFFAGHSMDRSDRGSGDQLAVVQNQLTEMRKMMIVSMSQQQNANDRLQAVSYSMQLQKPDAEVTQALLHAMRYDSSVDVRLAALDSLRRYAGQSDVRKGIVDTLQPKQNPMLQIALIDTLVDLKDKSAVDQFAKLKDAKGVDPSVKKHADWGINKLRS